MNKSKLLAQQAKKILGDNGYSAFQAFIQGAELDSALLSSHDLRRIFLSMESCCDAYAGMLSRQGCLSGDAFSDWNIKTERIESGPHWKGLLGYKLGEIGDQISNWRSLLHPDDFADFQSRLSAHVNMRSGCLETECRMRAKTGEWTWFLVRGLITARDPENKPLRMLVMHRNISAARKVQSNLVTAKDQAESAMAIRGAFVANMSHEIRTPMNGIIGMIELALDTQLDPEQRNYLKIAKTSADALLTVVNDILDFSKIDAGKVELEPLEFSVRDVVLEAARVLAINAHKKTLELIVDVEADVPNHVSGDPTRLRQVILNLAGNAIKFTDHGEIIIRVSLDKTTPGNTQLLFSVSDTGVGIPAESQTGIFEAFSQADVSTTRRFGGTGLGLAICSRLIELMQGRIWLKSEPGKGSVFSFAIPLASKQVAAQAQGDRSFAGKRALIVAGSQNLSSFLKKTLKGLGVECSQSSGIDEAHISIERTRALGFPYDFIIADYKIAGTSNEELTKRWCASGKPEMLIMMLTMENQREELKALRTLGVSTHLVKPFGESDLISALRLVADVDGTSNDKFELAEPSVDLDELAASEGLRVLLVEDNPVNQELAMRLLQKRNHSVFVANNGSEAVDLFEKMAFDVILMDMQMPVMDGLEATEVIRSREMRRSWVMTEPIKSVYIIAMTANVMSRERELCREAGMNDFVAKPVVSRDLYAALERARGSSSGEAQAIIDSGKGRSALVDLDAALLDIGDVELLATMGTMFLNDWVGHIERLSDAIRSRDEKAANMHAHTLRSLLSMFHANVARDTAREIELVANAATLDGWNKSDQLLLRLREEVEKTLPAFEALVITRTVY